MPANTKGLRLVVAGKGGDSLTNHMQRLQDDFWSVGAPESSLPVALREIVTAKHRKNDLRRCRPNVVAASVLVSTDSQMNLHRQRELNLPMPEQALPDDIDAVVLSMSGVNELTPEFFGGYIDRRPHPPLELFDIRGH